MDLQRSGIEWTRRSNKEGYEIVQNCGVKDRVDSAVFLVW